MPKEKLNEFDNINFLLFLLNNVVAEQYHITSGQQSLTVCFSPYPSLFTFNILPTQPFHNNIFLMTDGPFLLLCRPVLLDLLHKIKKGKEDVNSISKQLHFS